MAILTGSEIKRQYELGNIYISDFDESRLGPNSYDVTLSEDLASYITVDGTLDCRNPSKLYEFKIDPEKGYRLIPGKLYLGRTNEKVKTTGFAPMIEGRSSVGRLGIFIHSTAGFGDNGFEGFWTLEISVVQPVIIYPNIRIGQLYYHTLEGSDDIRYNGKYQNNCGIQASGLYKDFYKDFK